MKFIDDIKAASSWLAFKTRYYTGKNGDVLAWDFVERLGDRQAAIVVARTKESESYILTRCFRPPFNDYIWEFPAGLIDKGESPGEAALRELEEETGYRGKVKHVSCSLCSSAGLTNEVIYLVYVECDETPKSKVRLEVSEDITVKKLGPDAIGSFLKFPGGIIDAKLYAELRGRVA